MVPTVAVVCEDLNDVDSLAAIEQHIDETMCGRMSDVLMCGQKVARKSFEGQYTPMLSL